MNFDNLPDAVDDERGFDVGHSSLFERAGDEVGAGGLPQVRVILRL